jgi:hypothetical protein
MPSVLPSATAPRRAAAAALLCLLAAGPSVAAAADAKPLFPHRALYVVQLKSPTAGIAGARGAAATTLERTCDGWIATSRMTTDLTTDEGEVVRMDSRLSGWESTDGVNYRFVASSDFADTRESFKGSAVSKGPSGPAKVDYTEPGTTTLPLPVGTLFPVAHLRGLIDKARAGERIFTAVTFDGTEAIGPRQATAFIRPAAKPDAELAAKLGVHAAETAWSMRIAYFPADGSALTPDFEVESVQLENGIVAGIVAEYRDFSMVLHLQSIEPLEAPRC